MNTAYYRKAELIFCGNSQGRDSKSPKGFPGVGLRSLEGQKGPRVSWYVLLLDLKGQKGPMVSKKSKGLVKTIF